MQTPPPGSAPSNYPRPGLDDRGALREVATAQRQVVFCVLGQIAIFVLNGIVVASKIQVLSVLTGLGVVGLLIYTIISVIRLAKSMGLSEILYAVLMFVPCVSLITLLMLSNKATTQLTQAGIKVGLLGADPNSI